MTGNSKADTIRSEIFRLVDEYYDEVHTGAPFESGRSPVPVSGKVFGKEEMRSLVDSSLDFWLTTGRFNTAFEKKLGDFLGRRHVLSVNSGSSANLVALAAFTSPLLKDRALQPGDEVITCATGFPTTVNPMLLYGLVPVFLDVQIPTYNIDVTALEEALSERTRAIMIAHTLGNPFDLATIMAFAEKHDLWVIEDCCDALGSTYDGQLVGTFGDAGTLSFYPAHHITMGEGGAVFCERPVIRRAMESIRDWGRDCFCEPGKDNTCGRRFEWQLGDLPLGYDHKYTYSHLGFNLKITDMQAAVGLTQMDRLPGFIEDRKSNFRKLTRALSGLEEFFILPEATPNSDPSWFGYPLTIRDGAPFTRRQLLLHLTEQKIGTRLLFGSNLIRQPYMIGRHYRVAGELTNSDKVVDNSFWIGVYPGLGDAEISWTVDQIQQFTGKA